MPQWSPRLQDGNHVAGIRCRAAGGYVDIIRIFCSFDSRVLSINQYAAYAQTCQTLNVSRRAEDKVPHSAFYCVGKVPSKI
jgi:hypothetical protein